MNFTYIRATSVLRGARLGSLCWTGIFLSALMTCCQSAPLIVPDQSVMKLDEIGLYASGYRLRNGTEVTLTPGAITRTESASGAANQAAGMQNGREAWLLHPPWRGSTGVSWQEFSFALPRAPKIILSGATALRADAVGKSDGATFRVFIDGQKQLDVSRADANWQPFQFDLTANAGRIVTVRFETDPGPKDNSASDFALWGDRQLAISGFALPAVAHPAPPPLDLTRLVSQQNGSVAPPSGFVGKLQTTVSPEQAILGYSGADGTLQYRWQPQKGDNFLGQFTLNAQMKGDAPVELTLGADAHLEWTGEATLISSRLSPTPAGATLTRVYNIAGQTATVTIGAQLQGKSLVLDIACDKPLLRALEGGDWGAVLHRRALNLPYYSNALWYFSRENVFAGAFLDWTNSSASWQNGTLASYQPRTDGTLNPLHERLVYSAAWHLNETLPNISNAPSPFRGELSKRILLDSERGSPFFSIAADLQTLRDGGLRTGDAIIHTWQFGGFDNLLPQHVPANAAQGGDAAMRSLVQDNLAAGIVVALHENYADYYPNYPSYSESDIARSSDGSLLKAWFNPVTQIQSFGIKPTRVVPLAVTQSADVFARYGSRASYMDVHSAVPPWFHVDAEASQPDAGRFAPVWKAHRELWNYQREIHRGPVFGEGYNHWYWSGLLDGVEAQFGQGWSGAGSEAPFLVDFDVLKIHPLQLNYGMGTYERWWNEDAREKRGTLDLLDQYRMQTAAYNHRGYVGAPIWNDAALVWLESHLMPPLTARIGLSNAVAIDYQVNGQWLDTSAAVKARADWSRVRVRYQNGVTVWANGSEQPLRVENTTLPRYGWLAKGPGLLAGTTLRDGVVSDAAQTSDTEFVNARPASDWEVVGAERIRPTVNFKATGPRAFQATYLWQVGKNLLENYRNFVHFTAAQGAGGDIVFQQDHDLARPTSSWKAGETATDGPWNITIPPALAPGDYAWTIGLFASTGQRIRLQGLIDAQDRIVLGVLHLSADGTVSFTPTIPAERPLPVNREARVIDFGTIRTNGSVSVERDGADWVLRAFPANRPFAVELSDARFGHPDEARVENGWWKLTLHGAPTYRWRARK